MRFKLVPRQVSILVFDSDSLNYDASCQVLLYGDVGILYNVNGRKFYECFAQNFDAVMDGLGVTSIEGYAVPSHVRLARMAMKGVAVVDVLHEGIMAGHKMLWTSTKSVKKRDTVTLHTEGCPFLDPSSAFNCPYTKSEE